MNRLEILRVRFAGEEPVGLVEAILETLQDVPPESRPVVYRREGLGAELAVHFVGDVGPDQTWPLVSRLKFELGELGAVEHSVWTALSKKETL